MGNVISWLLKPPPPELMKLLEANSVEGIATALKEKRKLEEQVKKGIEPVVWPSREEISRAKQKLQFNDNYLHFAVAGATGTGKSSLINAIRGLQARDKDASPVGVNETTTEIKRFPDPAEKPPRAWFIWYDIPGANTRNVPGWQYFNTQGLFIFDFIIVAYDARLTDTDLKILENCKRFAIPSFIVRTHADKHIDSIVEDEGFTKEKACNELCKRTRFNVQSNLKAAGLDVDKKVYIISNRTLRAVVNKTTLPSDVIDEKKHTLPSDIIDEKKLIEDLIAATLKRRYKIDVAGLMAKK